MRSILIILFLQISSVVLLFAQEQNMLTTPEVYTILEKSDLNYLIKSFNELDSLKKSEYYQNLYMQPSKHVEYPFVSNTSNNITLSTFTFDSLAMDEVFTGERFYRKRDYGKALTHFENAIKISDSCYLAYLHAGDCYLMTKDFTKALEYYSIAKKINPYDYRCYFYCGTANMQLGNYSEAKNNYIYALSLKPSHKNLEIVLERYSSLLDIEFRDDTFKPKGGLNTKNDSIEVYINLVESDLWMPYILAKAMLKNEKNERMKYVEEDNIKWNKKEEQQALYCLLSSYELLKKENKIEKNEYFDSLLEMFENGDWPAFIIYEIASKMTPDVVLLLTPDVRLEIEKFIRKYIVVDI